MLFPLFAPASRPPAAGSWPDLSVVSTGLDLRHVPEGRRPLAEGGFRKGSAAWGNQFHADAAGDGAHQVAGWAAPEWLGREIQRDTVGRLQFFG